MKRAKAASAKSSSNQRSGGDRRKARGKVVARRTRPAAERPARRHDDPSLLLAKAIVDAGLDKKAFLPVLLDVAESSGYADFVAILSGRSQRQVDAVAEHIGQVMKDRGRRLLGSEGRGGGRWTLLDFGDVVVHVFHHPVRALYDLESLWIDAPRVPLAIPAWAREAPPDTLYEADEDESQVYVAALPS